MGQEDLDNILASFDELSENEKEKLIASITGVTIEEKKERHRVYQEAEKYRNLPIDKWPRFSIEWDYSPSNYCYALDGIKRQEFEELHPESLKLGEVSFEEFDSKLAKFSKRELHEIWTIGSARKVSRAILYWLEGNKMTPPLIVPSGRQINIGAGHHRVAVCKAKKITTLPFLARIEDCGPLGEILKSIKWK